MSNSSNFIIISPGPEIRRQNPIIDQRDFPGFNPYKPRANQTTNPVPSQVPEQVASQSQKQPQTATQTPIPIQVPSQQNAIINGNNQAALKQKQQPNAQINQQNNQNHIKSPDQSILELHDEYYPGDKQQIQAVPNKQTRVLPQQPKLIENPQVPAIQNQKQQQSLLAQKQQQNSEAQAIQQKSQQHPQELLQQKKQPEQSQQKSQPLQQSQKAQPQQQSQQKAQLEQQQQQQQQKKQLEQSQQKTNQTQLQQKQAHPNQQLTHQRQTAEIHNQFIKQQNFIRQQHNEQEPERPLAQPMKDQSILIQSRQGRYEQQQFDQSTIQKDVFIKYLPYFEAFGYNKNDYINDSDALKVLNTETVQFDQQVFFQLKEKLNQPTTYSVSEFLSIYTSGIYELEEKKKKQIEDIEATKAKLNEILTRMEESRLSEQPGKPSILNVHIIQAFGLQIPSQYRVRVKYDGQKEVITNNSNSSTDPIFNQEFKLELTNSASILQLTVENASNGKTVGIVTQKIQSFAHQRKIEEEYIFENEGGVLGDTSKKLFVGIQWVWNQTKLYETILTDNDNFDPIIKSQEQQLKDTLDLLDLLRLPFNRDLKKLQAQHQNTQKVTRSIAKKQEAKVAYSPTGWERSSIFQTFNQYAMYIFTIFALLICFFKPNFIDVCLGFVVISRFYEENHKYIVLICSLLGSIAVDVIQISLIASKWFQYMEYGTIVVIIFSFLVFFNTLVKIIYAVIFWKSRSEYEYNKILYGYKELD